MRRKASPIPQTKTSPLGPVWGDAGYQRQKDVIRRPRATRAGEPVASDSDFRLVTFPSARVRNDALCLFRNERKVDAALCSE